MPSLLLHKCLRIALDEQRRLQFASISLPGRNPEGSLILLPGVVLTKMCTKGLDTMFSGRCPYRQRIWFVAPGGLINFEYNCSKFFIQGFRHRQHPFARWWDADEICLLDQVQDRIYSHKSEGANAISADDAGGSDAEIGDRMEH